MCAWSRMYEISLANDADDLVGARAVILGSAQHGPKKRHVLFGGFRSLSQA